MRRYLAIVLFLTGLLFLISCDEEPPGYTGPWQEVPTPGGHGYLTNCYFNSPDDGWATGIDGAGGDFIFIHWNGNTWEEYQYPGWFDGFGTVKSIDMADVFFTSPNDGWAVGFVAFENDDFFGFVLRHNGNDWYLFETEVSFYEIYGISEDDVWFIGNSSNNSDLYHWNGVEFEYYDLFPGNYGLRDIAFSSSDEGLAVGNYQFVYHWDGTDWELVNDGLGGEARGVSYDTPTTAYIVEKNRLSRWEDGEYKVLSDDEWGGSYSEVHFSSPDEGWIIGSEWIDGELFSYTWHWDGNDWIAIEKPDGMSSYDIFSIDSDNVWIVGMHSGPYCCSWRYVNQ
jgi:hypothetical protein